MVALSKLDAKQAILAEDCNPKIVSYTRFMGMQCNHVIAFYSNSKDLDNPILSKLERYSGGCTHEVDSRMRVMEFEAEYSA